MRSSILRSIFTAPRYDESISNTTWREASAFRLLVLAACLVGDLAIVILGAKLPSLQWTAVSTIYPIAIVVVIIDMVVTAAMYTGRWRNRNLLKAIIAAEMIGTALIVYGTGTVNNGLILIGLGAIVLYRFYFGWAIAALAAATLVTLHFAAIGLELAGVLEAAPIFTGEKAPVFRNLELRLFTASILLLCYGFAFFGANSIVNLLRAKDRALAEIRAQMAQLADGLQQGRLSGISLADRYAIGELIGRGGMGEIYVGHDVNDDRKVAIKVLHQPLGCDMEMLQRFRREADLASRLPGDCTASVHSVGVDYNQNLHFIVMDHLRGEDLGAYLRRRDKLRPSEVLELGEQIARVLDAAHAAGIVHRDLKPQNVFLLDSDDGFDLRLLDFGIAKLRDNQTGPTLTQGPLILGTPGYMAPEQARGDTRNAGHPADRFALAAILFRALTGVTAFGDRTALEYVREVVDTPPRSASALLGTGPEIDEIFARALAKNPEDRYPCARSLLDALGDVLCPTDSERLAV